MGTDGIWRFERGQKMLKDESGANPGCDHMSMLGGTKWQHLPGSELCLTSGCDAGSDGTASQPLGCVVSALPAAGICVISFA